MINSVCLSATMRLSLAFRALLTLERPLHLLASRNSSAPVSLAMRGKRHSCARFSSHARRCSSETGSTDTPLEEKNVRMKSDPEIQAWMNQIAQDFEMGKEPFRVSTESDIQGQAQLIMPKVDEGSASKNMRTAPNTADIEIEDFGYLEDDEEEFQEVAPKKHVPISLDRGQHGVFDVEEMVAVLEDENGVDIKVIDIPPEIRFVDHMVVVSAKSLRHMRAMAASIEWMYKKKKRRGDRPFRLEGRECRDWFAMDLGNIAVHIFMPEARQHYDIETLWTLGPEHDDQRHYVQDDHLNLSAAELFWLETGWNDPSANQTLKDANTEKTSGSADDRSISNAASLDTSSDSTVKDGKDCDEKKLY